MTVPDPRWDIEWAAARAAAEAWTRCQQHARPTTEAGRRERAVIREQARRTSRALEAAKRAAWAEDAR